MKKISMLGIASLLFFASCKKTEIVDVIDARNDDEPKSYVVDVPIDSLTRTYLNNFCYGGGTDDLIGQRITNNKGKQRVYLVHCPIEATTQQQVIEYLDGQGYVPAGPGYLLRLVEKFATYRDIMFSAMDCKNLKMRDGDGTWKPMQQLLFVKRGFGTGCISGITTQTGNRWDIEVLYVCFKK